MTVEINISRLKYLLSLYGLGDSEFLKIISDGLKKELLHTEIFSDYIKLVNLKRIDRIFNKGISYYLDPSDPVKTDNASIFFRKKVFHSDLNLKSKKIVNEYEDLKHHISSICKLADIEKPRL